MLKDEHTRQWLIQTGRILMADLLRHDKKDPTEYFDAYDRMVHFISNPENFEIMKEDLRMRKVKFYFLNIKKIGRRNQLLGYSIRFYLIGFLRRSSEATVSSRRAN